MNKHESKIIMDTFLGERRIPTHKVLLSEFKNSHFKEKEQALAVRSRDLQVCDARHAGIFDSSAPTADALADISPYEGGLIPV